MTALPIWANELVSRETFEKLNAYAHLLETWSAKINLVSKNDLNHLFERHILDCVQMRLLKSILQANQVLDVGSGGGLPSVVLAVLSAEGPKQTVVTCVESDSRKCAFLNTVSYKLDLNIDVKCSRVESLDLQPFPIITARAFASLERIFELTENVRKDETTFVLPKGERWMDEVRVAQASYDFNYTSLPSKTNNRAAILEISNVKKL